MFEAVAPPRASASVKLDGDQSNTGRTLWIALLVAVGYYLTSKIGFAFALQPGSVSTLWMPNSILLTGLLLVPRRSWWIIVTAALPAHFASEVQSGVPALMVSSWFVSNSFQALIGAYFVRKFVEDGLRFDRVRDLTVFLFFAAFLAPFTASFLDVSLVKLNGWGGGSYWEIWRIRFLSNVLATLTLVPVIVSWTGAELSAIKVNRWRYLEAVVLTAGLIIVSITVFSSQHELTDRTPSRLYWPLPFLIWATARFGPLGVSNALLLVMFLAISGATHGQGPFVANSAATNALSIQWFLIVVSISLLSLAAVIEERKRTERAARQNEDRLALALNAAQMGTWDWNIGDDIATWSAETKQIFGRSPTDPEVTNEAFYALIYPDDRSRVQKAIERAIRDVSTYEAEFRMALPDGKTRWVRGKGKVVCDEQGKPQRMIGINTDITEQKQAQEDLQLSEMRRARAEAISLVMVTNIGLDGSWLKVPSTLCDLLGYTEKELLAGNINDVTHPDDLPNDRKEREQLIRGEIKSYGVEKRFFHKDGHTSWVFNNWSIVEDDLGKPLHFLTYMRDVTDRKLAELALYESNERNKAILRALPDLMFLQTREGVYLDYYAKDVRDLMVPPETFLGKNILDVMPRDLAEKVQECVERLKDHDDTQILEYSLPLGSEERHFEARLVIAEGDKVLSIVRDVTQPYRSADDLRKSQEQLLIRNREIRELAVRLMTAQESERRRIALLLHDDLSQNLAAMGIAISRLRRKPPDSNESLAAELDQLGKQTQELTSQIRTLSHQLHPDVLEHLGLVTALKSEVAEFSHNEHIKVGFTAELKSEQIPPDVSACLYRVALEALRNVARHSGAAFANVALTEDAISLTLEVSDSGRGFDQEAASHKSGLGLISAEERVRLLNGSFLVKSEPDGGTVLSARIPKAR